MRPAQNFDALKIGELEGRADRRSDIDAIRVQSDRRVLRQGNVILPKAPDEQADNARTAVEIVDEDVRDIANDVQEIGDLLVFQLLPVESCA